jgi:hypothetical protein
MVRMVFQRVYVLGEQYLLGQLLIRTKDGEDAVPKSINIKWIELTVFYSAGCIVTEDMKWKATVWVINGFGRDVCESVLEKGYNSLVVYYGSDWYRKWYPFLCRQCENCPGRIL